MREISLPLASPNYKKRDNKFNSDRPTIKTGRKGSEELPIKLNDITGVPYRLVRDPMGQKDP